MNDRDLSQIRGKPNNYEQITALQLAQALNDACGEDDGYLSWSYVEIIDDFNIDNVPGLKKIRCDDAIQRAVVDCSVVFSKVRFKGRVNFSTAKFLKSVRIEKSVFEQELDFSWAHFGELPSFKQTTFEAYADFTVARFFKGANFHRSVYQESVDFKSAQFRFPVHFDFSKFLGKKANFNGTEYEKLASFNYTQFTAIASFEFTRFNGTADYANANFEGPVEFRLAKFNGKAIFDTACFKNRANFFETGFHQGVQFKKVEFNVSNTFFTNTTFTGNLEIDYRYTKVPFWLNRLLAPGRHSFLDWSNVEKVDITNQYIQRVVNDERFIKEFEDHHPRASKFWQWSCDYGRSLSLWACWLGGIVFLFALIFFLLGKSGAVVVKIAQVSPVPPDIFTSVYYSIVTFTTLGFGDILPTNNLGRLFVVLEVVAGYVMLGGLISIFANKLARRS